MTRSRTSAKQAGSRFEKEVAEYLAAEVDDRIERRVRTGAKDRGDISGLRAKGQRVVAECKNVARLDLAGWMNEALEEAIHDGAALAVVIHKRKGIGAPARQWVTMELSDLAWLLREQP